MLNDMKISDKEKIMLCILGIIIIGFGYYEFIYSSQSIELQQKIKAESEIKQKYDNAMNTINSMEDKKSDVKILKAKINDETLPFYPIISEENIIIELDKLLKDSGLKGGVTFQPIVSDSVENSKKEEKSLAESSLQGIVDKYNSTFNDTEKTVNNSTKSETNNKDSNNASGTSGTNSTSNSNGNNSNSSNTSSKKDSKDTKKNTVQYLKCEVKFEGSYENLDKFLNTIENNEKKIVVNSMKLSSDISKGIKGTLNLEFYSVPKIDGDLEKYLEWNLNNNYGKSVPFATGTTNESLSSTTGTKEKETTTTKIVSDFLASVKSITSDLPKIMIGKAKDDLRTTYVYGDSNSEEKAEMIISQDGDKYYYKYKTSKGAFPANYDGVGEEFIPISKDIVLNIMSESRVDANDNSAIRLNIINKTDKTVYVNINGDDSSNPRVVIDGDESNIKVSKN
jgi:type IV pilus assembly protein PilO